MDTEQRRRAQLWPIRAQEWIRKHHAASDDPPHAPQSLHSYCAPARNLSRGRGVDGMPSSKILPLVLSYWELLQRDPVSSKITIKWVYSHNSSSLKFFMPLYKTVMPLSRQWAGQICRASTYQHVMFVLLWNSNKGKVFTLKYKPLHFTVMICPFNLKSVVQPKMIYKYSIQKRKKYSK